MRYYREFALGNGFAINDQHAGIESMPANMQHASKLGGTATNWGDKIKIKKTLQKMKKLLLQKERMEYRRAQGSFTNTGETWNS